MIVVKNSLLTLKKCPKKQGTLFLLGCFLLFWNKTESKINQNSLSTTLNPSMGLERSKASVFDVENLCSIPARSETTPLYPVAKRHPPQGLTPPKSTTLVFG